MSLTFRRAALATTAGALACLAAAGLTAPPALAAPPPPAAAAPPSAAQQPIMAPNDPRNALHLTADQQKRGMQMQSAFNAQVQALQANAKLTPQQKQAQYVSMQGSFRQQMIALLTPDQKKALDARMAAARASAQKYLAGATTARNQAQALSAKIKASITPAQKKKIDALRNSAATQVGAIEKNAKLTPLQKATKEQGLRASFQASLNTILTPEQRAEITQLGQEAQQADTLGRLAVEGGGAPGQ